MAIQDRRITFVIERRPTSCDLNESMQWFGKSLGLFGNRDRDKSCYRIFVELLKATKL